MGSALAAAMDKIVADFNDRLLWVRYSKNDLTREAARLLIQQWSNFTRHSRQCWAHGVGNGPHIEVRKFIVTENVYEEEAQVGHSHFEILAGKGMALGLTSTRSSAPRRCQPRAAVQRLERVEPFQRVSERNLWQTYAPGSMR